MISHEPVMMPQVTRRLIYQRYAGVVVFTDNYSDFTYTHLIKGATIEATVPAKRAYERVVKSHGVKKIKHYHADNLRFNAKEFKEDCECKDQTYSYCGVGVHHMNGVAESKNMSISYGARKLVLHARK